VGGIHAFILLFYDPVIATAAGGSPEDVPVHGPASHRVGGGREVTVSSAITAVAVAGVTMVILLTAAAAAAAATTAAGVVVAAGPKVGQGVQYETHGRDLSTNGAGGREGEQIG
jgi:hypothetical protein